MPAEDRLVAVARAIRREQGRLEEIHGLIRASVDEYPVYRSFPCLVALIDCELDRPAAAAARFDELAARDFADFPRDSEWLFCLSILSEVAAHLGDTSRAAALHRLLEPYENLFALASGEVSLGASRATWASSPPCASAGRTPSGTSRRP